MKAPTIQQLRKLAKLVWTEVKISRDQCACDKEPGHLYIEGVNQDGIIEVISVWMGDEESEREALGAALLRLSELRPDGEEHGIDKPGWLTRQMNRLEAQSAAWPRGWKRPVVEKG